jgi:Beta-galactosidase
VKLNVTLGLVAAGLLGAPLAFELRIKRSRQPLTDAWQTVPVEPRGSARLGISFRPPQVDALGLDARSTLGSLLSHPFQLIRLGAYWNRIEPRPGVFDAGDLDWQVDAAEHAGKQVVVCVGALKTFGYPELFVPDHRLAYPLREGTRIRPADHPSLLAAATEFVARIVDRYKARTSVVAWQVEHEAVDPLGFEHSWRLDAGFVQQEVAAVRRADLSRPVLMNGYLPASVLEALPQWWRTRDQGDSLALAQRVADIVGIDHYPCHALVGLGGRTLYLDGGRGRWQDSTRARLFRQAHASGRRVMVTEGQAEPWEAVTTPPNLPGSAAYSCPPERVIENYNSWMRWARRAVLPLEAYLFWGAEYWVLRHQSGDPRYVRAFDRILEEA